MFEVCPLLYILSRYLFIRSDCLMFDVDFLWFDCLVCSYQGIVIETLVFVTNTPRACAVATCTSARVRRVTRVTAADVHVSSSQPFKSS